MRPCKKNMYILDFIHSGLNDFCNFWPRHFTYFIYINYFDGGVSSFSETLPRWGNRMLSSFWCCMSLLLSVFTTPGRMAVIGTQVTSVVWPWIEPAYPVTSEWVYKTTCQIISPWLLLPVEKFRLEQQEKWHLFLWLHYNTHPASVCLASFL